MTIPDYTAMHGSWCTTTSDRQLAASKSCWWKKSWQVIAHRSTRAPDIHSDRRQRATTLTQTITVVDTTAPELFVPPSYDGLRRRVDLVGRFGHDLCGPAAVIVDESYNSCATLRADPPFLRLTFVATPPWHADHHA